MIRIKSKFSCIQQYTGNKNQHNILRCYNKVKLTYLQQFSTSASNSEEYIDLTCGDKDGKFQRPIYVAATKQHAGKTTVSLALMSGLTKRFGKVGFIKPVGQQHVPVQTSDGDEVRVDKDVSLLREYFNLSHVDYKYMSPVIIPRGYTKDYLDGHISFQDQLDSIKKSYSEISKNSDVVLIEGTGHCGVGSIVNLNNAKVASILGADMVNNEKCLLFFNILLINILIRIPIGLGSQWWFR